MSLSLKPVLTDHEIVQIHEQSLELLERVGIEFKTRRALDVLERAGCVVDYDRNWASLPCDLVEEALSLAPRVVRLQARDPERDVVLSGRRSHHTCDSQGTQAIDLETGERRDSTAEDLRRGLLFADALDQIEIVNVMCAAGDVPAHVRTLEHFAMAFTQTSKHVRTGVLNAREVPFLVELVKAVTGSDEFQPIFSVVDCTISPLMHDGPMTEACIDLAALGVPILIYPMPLAGGTSPATLAGTILLHNIEFLSGLVLYQVVNPGTPIIYGTGASQLDMRTGRYGGSADGHAMHLALVDLARYYNLPVNAWGLSTASSELDALYGYEATAQGLLMTLAGADEIYSMGLLGSAQTLSLDKMVLDNHLARQIGLMHRPLCVDGEHLQAGLIERVGIGGHYLGQRETRAFLRHGYVPVWPAADTKLLEMIRSEALDILHNHQPPPLPVGAAEQIEAILAEADRELARRGTLPGGSTVTKEEILTKLAESRQELLRSTEGLSEEEMTWIQVEGVWTIKDVLGHIASWEEICLKPLQRYADGNLFKAEVTEDYLTLNVELAARKRDIPLVAILDELDAVRQDLVVTARRLSDAQWEQGIRFPWGYEGPVAEMLEELQKHEQEHVNAIRRWRDDRS